MSGTTAIKHIIVTSAPKPVGAYSTAVQVLNTLHLSGVIGLHKDTNQLVDGGVIPETEQVFNNIKDILEECGSSLKQVVTVKVYLDDIANSQIVNEIYQRYMKPPYPARCLMQVVKLPLGAKIEMEILAMKNGQSKL